MREKAVIYARFSPRPGRRRNPLTGLRDLELKIEDGETLECQFEVCRRYCEMRDFEIMDEIGDRFESACTTPVFQRKNGKQLEFLPLGVKHIVVAKLDRLFRNVVHGMKMLEHWRKIGVNIHLANQSGNSIDLSTAIGELFLTMLLGIGRFEARQCSERTSQMMKHRQKSGQRMTPKHLVPYGKMTDPSKPENLIDNPHELDMMVECYDMHITQGLTFQEICNRMISQRIMFRAGKWTPGVVYKILNSSNFPWARVRKEEVWQT